MIRFRLTGRAIRYPATWDIDMTPVRMYELWFDFDCEGEAPSVLISDETGSVVLEVFEEPTCTEPQWTSDSEDWQAGPLALQVLNLLNGGSPA